jgi:hypothetical protein
MSGQSSNSSADTVVEEENDTPTWRVVLVTVASLLALLTSIYLIHYVIRMKPKPDEFGASTILLYSLGALAVLVVPWKKIGLIPTEIGGVKFERIFEKQKAEEIETIVQLRSEITALTEKVQKLSMSLDMIAPTVESSASNLEVPPQRVISGSGASTLKSIRVDGEGENVSAASGPQVIQGLVVGFLRSRKGLFLSPQKIRAESRTRVGYKLLYEVSLNTLKEALYVAVSEKKITTKISRLGNTLYGMSKNSHL